MVAFAVHPARPEMVCSNDLLWLCTIGANLCWNRMFWSCTILRNLFQLQCNWDLHCNECSSAHCICIYGLDDDGLWISSRFRTDFLVNCTTFGIFCRMNANEITDDWFLALYDQTLLVLNILSHSITSLMSIFIQL